MARCTRLAGAAVLSPLLLAGAFAAEPAKDHPLVGRYEGAVLDGYSRDTNEVLELGLPVFSLGGYSQDQGPRGKVVDYRVPVEIQGVYVRPGDIVFGDQDGVLIVPKEAEVEAFRRALEKASTENAVRTAIRNGMSTVEAFETFGVM